MPLAPILLFVYNRFWHFRQTLEALQKNDLAAQSELFIFSDGAKTVADSPEIEKIRSFSKGISGFKNINLIEREKNYGLAKSVILGVTEVIEKYEKVIVLEDDLLCSSDFLDFMNEGLDFYQNNLKIFTLSGYSYPFKIPDSYQKSIYFNQRASSWGWATWKDRWQKTDWEVKDFKTFIRNKDLRKKFNEGGEDLSVMLAKQQLGLINSWAVRWCYTQFKERAYCVFSVKPKISNIGLDGSGTHSPKSNRFAVKLEKTPWLFSQEIELNPEIQQNFKAFFSPSWYRRVLNWFFVRRVVKSP